ncbi:nitrosative stress-sensing transcriptional regulator HcpR [uncultured Porphyromonas sp.]|jgi:putative transcriptional regulator|uniref:nitrosative stress-sensing transcriptional regulator HcpR n=1 Tax=uncultured Porphyromonas sp. TaxID=159274 RepID=UPI00262614BC|nr:nitrosative stress-sensing transcriptional regulator HcpR [uncultured Porphyromonas sp.]
MTESDFDLLLEAWQRSGLAGKMSTEEVAQLLRGCPCKKETLKRGELYAIGGDKLRDLRIVGKGGIKAEMVGTSGKQLLMDTLTPGRIVAPALLFAEDNALPVTLMANEESILFRMGKEDFRDLMHQSPQLMTNFIGIVSNISVFLMGKIYQLSLRSLQGKIADYLLQIYLKEGNKRLQIDSSWKELADRFGVNRQSLARSLAQLEEEGLLRVEGKSIEILQPHRMAGLE